MKRLISNRRDDLAASFEVATAAVPPRVRAEAAERAAYSTERTAIPTNESTPGVARRTGWILSGIVIAFMVADAGADLLAIEPIKKSMLEIGYPLGQRWLIGALALICTVLYAIPATSMLGAIILTGFLGGAITSHLRVAGTLTPEMILGVILGVLAWGGLWFRDPRLRVLIPRRRDAMPRLAPPNVPGAS